MYRNHNKTKFELRSLFKRHIDQEEYRLLTHFVYVKKIKEPIPGTWSMYIYQGDHIAVATNALCINEWCQKHNLPRRRPFTEKHAQMKIRVNGTDKIDNRTDKWTWGPARKDGAAYTPRKNLNPGENIRELVWDLYVHENLTATEISHRLGFTAPNIYYHLKRKQLEIDTEKRTQ